jgi:hypothetical protein
MKSSLLRGVNVAVGKRAEQSSFSQWSTSPDESINATFGTANGNFSFHTDLEERPWWKLDFGTQTYFDEIIIYNRLEFAERASLLQIRISDDNFIWKMLYKHNGTLFGGADGSPLCVSCPRSTARYLEISIPGKQFLHLVKIEVYASSDENIITNTEIHPKLVGPTEWDQICPELRDRFTLGGAVPVKHWFFRDEEVGTSIVWPKHMIWTGVEKAKRREDLSIKSYDSTSVFDLYNLMDRYPVRGRDVVVIGSLRPWIEVCCLAFGAKSVSTVDYNPPTTESNEISVMNIEQFNKKQRRFDVVISFSSIEHDGLGRYGDPINPAGDIKTMSSFINILNPGGLMFLGVPCGLDMLYWNAHRVYGELRFPKLISQWKIVDIVNNIRSVDEIFKVHPDSHFQPWWVLAPRN